MLNVGSVVALVMTILVVAPRAYADLLVSSFGTNSIMEFDSSSGAFLGTFANVSGPSGTTFGPDGDFYVASISSNTVSRYTSMGSPLGTFAAGDGLQGPAGITFGPDGNLYVVSECSGTILRFDGTSGASLGTFAVIPGTGHRVPIDLHFGPDANLYVSTQLPKSEILRFSGSTGALLDSFASGGGLFFPAGFLFGPDGQLYVNDHGTDSVLRYDGKTGAFLDTFAEGPGLIETTGDNSGLAFLPTGDLLVSNGYAANVARFNAVTGAFEGFAVSGGTAGLNDPTWLSVRPIPEPGTIVMLIVGLLPIVTHECARLLRRTRGC